MFVAIFFLFLRRCRWGVGGAGGVFPADCDGGIYDDDGDSDKEADIDDYDADDGEDGYSCKATLAEDQTHMQHEPYEKLMVFCPNEAAYPPTCLYTLFKSVADKTGTVKLI